MSRRFNRGFVLLPCVLTVFGAALAPDADPAPAIPILTIDDSIINPVTAEYIMDAIDRAESEQSSALVIELDTPGGLLTSTRMIVKKIMNAKVPVIVYVAPSGSRAGSAGVFITLAAHVAAMAPSTNIGAAHPVEMGESPGNNRDSLKDILEGLKKEKGQKAEEEKKKVKEPADPMSEKILNDTLAWVATIAKERGRNVDWAQRAVRESVSAGEDEALRLGVIDVVAKDLEDLIVKMDGKKVRLAERETTLHLAGVPQIRMAMSLRQRILNVLINPNIAYILLILGFYGLLFEITHPGSWFPGIAGLICLILAFYAFQTLPTNYAGLALITLALVLFIAEVKVVSYGFLTLAGLTCMFLGSLLLFDTTADFLRVSLRVVAPAVLSTAAIFVFLISLAVRAQRRPKASGVEALVGMVGEVSVDLPKGKVTIDGEIWNAVSGMPVLKGEKVRIVAVEGMTLKVEKL